MITGRSSLSRLSIFTLPESRKDYLLLSSIEEKQIESMASTSNSTPVVVKDEPMDEASEGVAPVQNGSGPAMATDRAPPAPREPHPLDAVFDFLFNSDEFKDDNEALVENGGEAMANDGDGLKSLVRDNDRLLPLPPADAPTEAERFLEQYLK